MRIYLINLHLLNINAISQATVIIYTVNFHSFLSLSA